MESLPHVKLWMSNAIPAAIREAVGLRGVDPSEDDAGALEIRGELILFVAHVPSAVLADPVYQRCNGQAENLGWMREGEIGLFGVNALTVHPHPEGDGILIVGSAV